MSIYSFGDHESGKADHLTASIERCASRSAEVNGISLEDFTDRVQTAVEYAIAQQEDPAQAWREHKRFNISEALGRVGISNRRDIAIAPFVRLLHNRIKLIDE